MAASLSAVHIILVALMLIVVKVSPQMLENQHPRYRNATVLNPDKLRKDVLLFIAITSGPHHTHLRHAIRSTWAIPCQLSPDCDYRFFVDVPRDKMSPNLQLEAIAHNDMEFRSSCDLMKRHPASINYGNSPPLGGNLKLTDENTSSPTFGESIDNPDYPARRMYKIDWKICFIRWTQSHYTAVGYYVFVEDDSFVCTENLLFQFQLLKNKTLEGSESHTVSHKTTKYTFRLGTPLYDGFDDSSTMLDALTASIFADHYGSPQLHCFNIENATDKGLLEGTSFLSWGNSFRRIYCDWLGQIAQNFNVTARVPTVTCTRAKIARNGVVEFPCLDQPLILHHTRAPELVLRKQSEARVRHVCEYMWLIDKVKEPEQLFHFWNAASLAHSYHDFSPLFIAENDYVAWKQLLDNLERDEKARREARPLDCQDLNSTLKFPCLFESNLTSAETRRRLRCNLSARVSYRAFLVPPLIQD